MLFNSYAFILLFLPLAWGGYVGVLRWCPRAIFAFSACASFAFIFAGGPRSALILTCSVVMNYLILKRMRPGQATMLWIGVIFNLLYIAYFKYVFFITTNLAPLFPALPVLKAILPIGISFYTFQSITALLDTHRGKMKVGGFWNFALYITFFPQLIAGPIVHYNELAPQFARPSRDIRVALWSLLPRGVVLFILGLAKKVIVADYFGSFADQAFASVSTLTSATAWQGVLSYSFQIYFDFSGYVDMALGVALCFGIKLPENFNSPYKSTSFAELWHRWHITLSQFLRDHLYIPMGGSRSGPWIQLRNLLLTMTIGGLWHGAAWGFVLWGALHGFLLCLNHMTNQLVPRFRLVRPIAVPAVFLVTTLLWVPFRAMHWEPTVSIWRKLGDLPALLASWSDWKANLSVQTAGDLGNWLYGESSLLWATATVLTFGIIWAAPNSRQIADHLIDAGAKQFGFRLSPWLVGFGFGLLFAICLLVMNLQTAAKFIYFQF